MTKNAQWDRAATLCPPERYGSPEWSAHYEANPDILTKMLGDLFRVYRSEEAKRAGTANPSGGRRKSYVNGNLDELWSIVTPKFSMLPFHQAFEELKGKRSLRAFAMRCDGIDFKRLSKLVKTSQGSAGTFTVVMTRYDLEVIAKAGGVHPSFFLEWRLLIVQELIAEVFINQPNLSIAVLRTLSH